MGDGDIMYLHRCEGEVADEAEISCIVRIATAPDWKSNKTITSFSIEEDLIEVRVTAPQVDDHDYDDQHG